MQVVDVTDDRQAAAERLASSIDGLSVDDALATPFLALGTHDEIAEHLRHAEARWGIGYVVVRDAEAFAPVLESMRGSITLRIEPVTPERWDDVETLFGRNGAYANCWCTWWTWRASEWDRTTAAERKARLRAQVEGDEKPGLLAYDGDEPVGWCAIAPRQRYGRLTSPRARTYRPLDDRPSWVVTPRGDRGR